MLNSELNQVAENCPCGQPPAADNGGVIYWHKATGRQFCSPGCGLLWHEAFWVPFCAHSGRSVTTGELNGR